jgi:hypothetical protein
MSVDAPVFAPPVQFEEPGPDTPSSPDGTTPDGCAIVWEAPPAPAPRGRSGIQAGERNIWFAEVALPQLKARPGEFAKIMVYTTRSGAGARLKRMRDRFPGVKFVVRQSGVQGGKPVQPEWSALYAAWVDGGDENIG